jgi:uncharacterized protein (TIGR02246 family)
MKTVCLAFVSVVSALIWFSPSDCRADQAEDDAMIRKNAATYVDAYNKRDAKAVAALWSPDAVYLDPSTGEAAVGREEIEAAFADVLSNLKEGKLEVEVKAVEFVSPNVAIENGTARVIQPDTEPVETNYTAINVKRDGKWLLDRISEEETPEPQGPPPSNYEHLKDLEWMVGSWIDQDEDATVQTDCSWTKNQNYLNRSFAVVVGDQVDMAGMQMIGWDPKAKQIRSWIFDSNGGFSEGKWTRKGDRWLIQQNGTLPDGSTTAAVNIINRVDDNSFTWQSVNREINGDILPNVDEVLVVRKPTE